MKTNLSLFILSLVLILPSVSAQAQSDDITEQITIQPTVMVVPFVKQDEDMRAKIENDQNIRLALSKVKQGFDEREFTTYDFIASYRAMVRRSTINMENQSDLKQLIIAESGTDIYVDTDLIINKTSSGNSAQIILQAYDQSTGQSLSNASGSSGVFRTDQIGVLVEKASEDAINKMLDMMMEKFTAMRSEGRSFVINFNLANDASITMNEPKGEKNIPLKFVIRDWLKQNAHNGYYHMKGSTETSLSVDDFRLPASGQIGDLEYEMYSFFQDIGLSANTSLVGQELVVTITE